MNKKPIRMDKVMISRNSDPSIPVIHNELMPEARVVLCQGDAEDFTSKLPDRLVTLIVTSPPYNIGKDYEERVSIDEYLSDQARIISELCRVLSDTGSICWQVGNFVQDGEIYPLDYFYYQIFKKNGLHLRNRIIWHYEHGLHAKRRFSGRYETILWFTKSDEYVFNLDQVRVPSKYPGKRYSKGPNKGKLSGNPKGKNPSDYWEIAAEDWNEGVWNIPNVKANHVEKTEHPCQFPVELVERCVLAWSDEDDWVLDPFAGVGSTLVAAIKHGRRAIGCEKEARYVELASQRILDFVAGDLRTRPVGKPIYQPKTTERVARVPDEWRTSEDSIYSVSGD